MTRCSEDVEVSEKGIASIGDSHAYESGVVEQYLTYAQYSSVDDSPVGCRMGESAIFSATAPSATSSIVKELIDNGNQCNSIAPCLRYNVSVTTQQSRSLASASKTCDDEECEMLSRSVSTHLNGIVGNLKISTEIHLDDEVLNETMNCVEKMLASNQAMEALIKKPVSLAKYTNLPQDYDTIMEAASRAMRYGYGIAAYKDGIYPDIAIKEIIPGVEIPISGDFFFPDAAVRYTNKKDVVIREMNNLQAKSSKSILPIICNKVLVQSSDGVPVDQCLQSDVYPDLSEIKRMQKKIDDSYEIVGREFTLRKKDGVSKITSLNHKRILQPSVVDVVGVKYPTNELINQKLPKGKMFSGGRKARIESDGKRSFIVMYLIAMLAVGVNVNAGSVGIMCGDDRHGSLWRLPTVMDCEFDDRSGWTTRGEVFAKPKLIEVIAHMCYSEHIIDITMMGFLGTLSHLDHKVERKPLSEELCRGMIVNKDTKLGKLEVVSESLWRTKVDYELKYAYCCTSDTYEVVNYVLRKIPISVHLTASGPVMVSSDIDTKSCSVGRGSCSTETGVVIWQPVDPDCLIEKIGEGNFTKLPDGSHFSSELQLSLETTEMRNLCGKRLMDTKQGVYFRSISGLYRERRDVDAAEKSFLLTAAQTYTDSSIEYLHRLQCMNDALLVNYLLEMSRNNPSRMARVYLARNDIAAKFVGELLLIWKCISVEIHEVNYSHNRNGVCYDLIPIVYELGNTMSEGFYDSLTKEVFPRSPSHDCKSVSGYAHFVDGEMRMYHSDGNHTTASEVHDLPSHTPSNHSEHFKFRNNELHSLYGPAGSRYMDGLVNELASLAGNVAVDSAMYANPEYKKTLTAKLHSVEEALKGWAIAPWLLMVKLLLFASALVVLYFVVRRRVRAGGVPWEDIELSRTTQRLRDFWRNRSRPATSESTLQSQLNIDSNSTC